jgi:hypothetical protein
MRFISIPPFRRKIEIPDFEFFVRARLSQELVFWPDHAISLLGYMGWPNDPGVRANAMRVLRGWSEGDKTSLPGLRRIQTDWTRVADILSLHYDLAAGGHQAKRGGSSIGKAIALANANSRSRGTGVANLWNCWKAYKDVAHLVTAATIICYEACRQANVKSLMREPKWSALRPFGEFGLAAGQFQPFPIAMMMPDFVIAVALWWQTYGLDFVPHSRDEPVLAPETLWRIQGNINVAPIPPPRRKIRPQDIAVLNARRAGNRGRAKSSKITPVSR